MKYKRGLFLALAGLCMALLLRLQIGTVLAAELTEPVDPAPTSGTCGETVNWELDGGVLVVSGTGAMYDYPEGDVPWAAWKDSIYSIEISGDVTYVGEKAFAGCTIVEEIQMHDSAIEFIASEAFQDCGGVLEIEDRFLSFPASLSQISDNAFENAYFHDVYYQGPRAQWKMIDKGNNGAFLSSAEFVHTQEEGKCGANLTWELGWDDVLRISGTGDMYDFELSDSKKWNDSESEMK